MKKNGGAKGGETLFGRCGRRGHGKGDRGVKRTLLIPWGNPGKRLRGIVRKVQDRGMSHTDKKQPKERKFGAKGQKVYTEVAGAVREGGMYRH